MKTDLSLPLTKDLALIAATLMTGSDEPDRVAKHALELWMACDRAVKVHREKLLSEEKIEVFIADEVCERDAKLPGLLHQWPNRFPIRFKELLRCLLKGKTRADRIGRFRNYLRWRLVCHGLESLRRIDGKEARKRIGEVLIGSAAKEQLTKEEMGHLSTVEEELIDKLDERLRTYQGKDRKFTEEEFREEAQLFLRWKELESHWIQSQNVRRRWKNGPKAKKVS